MGRRMQVIVLLSRWRKTICAMQHLAPIAAALACNLSTSTTDLYIESEEKHTQHISRTILKAQTSDNEDQVFQALLHDPDCSKIELSNQIVDKLLDQFSNDWKSCLGFFRWAGSRPGYTYAHQVFDKMLDILGKMKETERMLTLVKEIDGLGLNLVTLQTVAKIMRRLAGAGKWEETIKTFNDLGQDVFSNLKKNTDSMNLLLDTLCKEGRVELARKMFLELKTHIAPNAHTFNIFIHGWCKAKRIDEANWTIQEMKGYGFPPTVISYSTLLQAYCNQSNFRMVYELLDKMKLEGCNPNVVTYTSLMHSLAKSEEFEEAFRVFEKMKLDGCKPDTLFYNSVINILGRAGKLSEARHVFEVEMPVNHVPPNLSTYNTMIALYCHHFQEQNALKILREMEESIPCTKPDLLTYNPLLKLCFKTGRMDTLGKILKDMVEKHRLSLDLDTYTLLVHGLCREGKCEWACLLFQEMIGKGITPRHRTCSLLLDEVEGKNMEDTFERIKALKAHLKKSPQLS